MLTGQRREGIRDGIMWCLCFDPELSEKHMESRHRHPVSLHALPRETLPLLMLFREELHGNHAPVFQIETLEIS
jgi:hypothetical protein